MKGVRKFRKKPVVVDAWQFTRVNYGIGAPHFIRSAKNISLHSQYGGRVIGGEISTLEGVMKISENDWIIKGVQGEFYPIKPDIFAATYEPVTEEKSITGSSEIPPASWHIQPQEMFSLIPTRETAFTGNYIIYSRQDDDSVQQLAVVDGSHPEAVAVANIMAAAPELRKALNHPALRELLRAIEDSSTPESSKLWALACKWAPARNAAPARAEGRDP